MIVTVIGARPQFIKAAVVSKQFIANGIEERILHTGQHYDEQMSAVFWKELGIPPYELNLNVGSGSHAVQTAQMLIRIAEYLQVHKEKIKAVLVYGDTNSTLAAALAASKLGIKIIHIESGLRSFNREMPEEINRIMTDHLADVLFCPSSSSVEQLSREGIIKNVFDVGDVMYDALLQFSDITISNSPKEYNGHILVTIHRPSNTDNPVNLRNIFSAIGGSSHQFVWPVHPRTAKILEEQQVQLPANLSLVKPFSYFEMLHVLKNCYKVMTDSGGLQKEAYWMKKPCITLRNDTEWAETLHNNWNLLTGPDTLKIKKALAEIIELNSWVPLYGDGSASQQISHILKKILY